MINIVGHDIHGAIACFRVGYTADPIRYHHPSIERYTDHRFFLHKCLNHFITELPIMVHKLAAIIMTGPNRTLITLYSIPKSIII
jgi:hypothetical protein